MGSTYGGDVVMEVWINAAWRHVRADDRVRLGTAEADVITSSTAHWHVDPNSNRYSPTAWEHEETLTLLKEREGKLVFPPDDPIDILMTHGRHREHLFNVAFPGTERV